MAEAALAGLRVLEDGEGIAAAYAAKLLADLGADVIKVEPPRGDHTRRHGPFPADAPHPERSGLFLFLNTNKRSVTLDLHAAAGRRAFRDLAARVDVLITNRAPAEQEALGLTYDDLAAANPALAMSSITVWGLDTPYRDWHGESLTATVASGLPFRIGDPDREPLAFPFAAAAFQGGVHGAALALLARRRAKQTGEGQHAWLSIVEILGTVMAGSMLPTYVFGGQVRSRGGVHMNAFYPWQVTPVQDGYFEVITMVDSQWEAFMDLLGNPPWREDERLQNRWLAFQHAEELDAFWHPWMADRTKAELWQLFRERHISFQPVHTIDEVVESDQLRARGFWQQMEHPAFEQPLTMPGAPYRLGATPWAIRRPPPLLGQHTQEVLGGVGYDATTRGRLARAGVTA